MYMNMNSILSFHPIFQEKSDILFYTDHYWAAAKEWYPLRIGHCALQFITVPTPPDSPNYMTSLVAVDIWPCDFCP